MGYQRIFACARSDASAQRLASGAHWNQEALPYLLFLVHTVLRSVRLESGHGSSIFHGFRWLLTYHLHALYITHKLNSAEAQVIGLELR